MEDKGSRSVISIIGAVTVIGIFEGVSGYCRDGWTQCGNHCFYKVDQKMVWSDAKRYCEDHYGADLASLYSKDINSVTDHYKGDAYWISLNDRDKEGSFLWTAKSEKVSLHWSGWEKGEPNNSGDENCVEVLSSTEWNDVPCTYSRNSLCSRCIPGLTGLRCDKDIDECASNPCQNGNVCMDSLGEPLNYFKCHCIEGHEGNVCERDCRPGPTDILFLVDKSSSQNDKTWNSSLQYIRNFVGYLPIGEKDIQVAVASYSRDTELLISFDQYHNRSNLSQAIIDLSLPETSQRGPTLTAHALKWADETLHNTNVGARVNANFEYIFLLTDGLSTDRQDAVDAARNLRNNGVRLYVIGIGDQIAHSELYKLASKSDQPYVFSSENQAAINRFWHDETDKECLACNATSYVDLLILMDASVNMTSSQLQLTITSVIHKLGDYLTDTHTDVHVAMASYSDDVMLLFPFTDCMQELHSKSQKIYGDDKEGNISRALSFSKRMFSKEHGAREDARKVVFLFSNGLWASPDDIPEYARELYAENIELSVIVVDPDDDDSNEDSSNLDNVLKILKNPYNMYYVKEDMSSVLKVLSHTTRVYECEKRDFN